MWEKIARRRIIVCYFEIPNQPFIILKRFTPRISFNFLTISVFWVFWQYKLGEAIGNIFTFISFRRCVRKSQLSSKSISKIMKTRKLAISLSSAKIRDNNNFNVDMVSVFFFHEHNFSLSLSLFISQHRWMFEFQSLCFFIKKKSSQLTSLSNIAQVYECRIYDGMLANWFLLFILV